MLACLTLAAFVFAAEGEEAVRVKVPARPFECAFVRSYCFDEAGRNLVCISQRGELLAWDENADDPVVTTLEKKPGGRLAVWGPMSVVLANRGRDAVLFYHDGRAQVWNVATGTKTRDLESDRQGFHAARMSPNGELVACLSFQQGADSAILFWNTRDWTPAGRIVSAHRINDFCFAGDGRQVLACVGHPTDQKHLGFTGIVAWDLATKGETGSIEYGSGFPIRIAVSADGRWVATGGGDAVPVSATGRRLSGHLRIFNWERKTFVAEPYTLERDYVRTVQFSPDSQHLYSGSTSDPPGGSGEYGSVVRAFRLGEKEWAVDWRVTIGNGNAHELRISPNGKDLLVPESRNLQIVDARNGTLRGTKLTFRFYPDERDDVPPDPLAK